MIGALLGDMIGAPYEFDRGDKTKDFPLFSKKSGFTDDSVMTIAVAEALLDTLGKNDEVITDALVTSMKKWGKMYPNAGYGGMFIRWLHEKNPKPYGSYGNGSAMRVSSVGWLFDDLDTTRHMAALTASVSHNHPEGIKGAEAIANAIFLARNGSSKEEIKDYIIKEFSYDLSRTCDEIRELSIAAECRGTDATGISYIKNGEIITFKKAKPAHKLHLYFPHGTKAVIGHNRMTTQGSEKKNYNNHPFNGRTAAHSFAFAHNGVLYNGAEMQKEYSLPETPIETDSYTAVQVLETFDNVDYESVKAVSEAVRGSFVFTILRDDNTIFLVKGDNPLTVYCYPELGLFVYASTKAILDTAVKLAHIHTAPISYIINEGDIIRIDPDGKISVSKFEMKEDFRFD